MDSDLLILPECFIDTALANTLSFPKRGYKHKRGCNNVLLEMKKKPNNALFGIIDNDKCVPPEFSKSFKPLKTHNENLTIYKHNERQHYIVTIGRKGKAVEDFILKNAEKCNIKLAEYNLPTDLSGLIEVKDTIKSVKDAELKFKKLFSTLKQNQHSDFHTLAKWIEQFKATPYDLNANSL